MGDRLTVGQMTLQPQMYQSAGSMADQTKHLNKLTFNPPALDGAIEALAGGASVVEPSTEDAGSAVTVPALLVVHPKIGALFIDGLLPLGALMAARTIPRIRRKWLAFSTTLPEYLSLKCEYHLPTYSQSFEFTVVFDALNSENRNRLRDSMSR